MLGAGHAYVMDFGIAKALSEATDHSGITSAGLTLGTPAYMAPEQAAAAPDVDHRADIYAIGTVLYEMLAGHPPFSDSTAQRIFARQMTEIPAPVQGERPDTPDALARGIERALEKDPSGRWQSAAELLPAIESGLADGQAAAGDGRRPWIAAAVVGLALATIAALLLRDQSARGMLVAGQTRQLTFDAGLELDPAISPDGQMLAYIAGGPEAGELFVKQRDGDRPVQPAPTLPRPQRSPKWSPDGTRIALQTPTGIFVIPALGGLAHLVPGSDSGRPALRARLVTRRLATRLLEWRQALRGRRRKGRSAAAARRALGHPRRIGAGVVTGRAVHRLRRGERRLRLRQCRQLRQLRADAAGAGDARRQRRDDAGG